jgi:hypothetical protein
METLAAWVPTNREMEVKLMFGEHIWDVAQHADALGKRTHELRLPLQHSLRATDEYVQLLDEVNELPDTSHRIAGFYDVLLHGLAGRYQGYLQSTDSLMDAPTVRILEQILIDEARMIRQSEDLRKELPNHDPGIDAWIDAFRMREKSIPILVAESLPR